MEEVEKLQETVAKLTQQVQEATRRENVLNMRLATKQQELQDTLTQVHDLKQSQSPSTAQLHSMLMDPAVNLMFLKMKSELKDVKEKLAQAQTDLSAWKFSTDRSVGTATVSIVRRVLTNYYIDRCFMTTCLLYHMICMLCHMHHCSHEPSSMSQPTHHKHNKKIQLVYYLGCTVVLPGHFLVSCAQNLHLCCVDAV